MVVKSVGVLSGGKVLGSLSAVLGLIYVGVMIFLAVGRAPAAGPNAEGDALANGIIAVICIPILCGLLGFIGGILLAALYNVLARGFGGIEITLGERERQGDTASKQDAS